MVLHCDWSTWISVLPLTPPHLVSCINPSTERKQQNHPSDPSAHIQPRGEFPLRVLTGKLQCEVTPPEDGNLEPRYRNISSCVGKSD